VLLGSGVDRRLEISRKHLFFCRQVFSFQMEEVLEEFSPILQEIEGSQALYNNNSSSSNETIGECASNNEEMHDSVSHTSTLTSIIESWLDDQIQSVTTNHYQFKSDHKKSTAKHHFSKASISIFLFGVCMGCMTISKRLNATVSSVLGISSLIISYCVVKIFNLHLN
jgi:hypothetical protein